jgi:hypothetical protein
VRSERRRSWVELGRHAWNRRSAFTKRADARVTGLEALCALIGIRRGLHVGIRTVRIDHSSGEANAWSKLVCVGNALEVVCSERTAAAVLGDRIVRLACLYAGSNLGCGS